MKSQHAGLVHSSEPWEGPAAPAFPLCPCTVFQDRTQLGAFLHLLIFSPGHGVKPDSGGRSLQRRACGCCPARSRGAEPAESARHYLPAEADPGCRRSGWEWRAPQSHAALHGAGSAPEA